MLSVLLMAMSVTTAAADLRIVVQLTHQEMLVQRGGETIYVWKVSTARRGYRTPVGRFRPLRLERIWYSTRYDRSPMPYSIFFHHGYAIHGTFEIRRLGHAVSHGCIRLSPRNARTLFGIVAAEGLNNTLVVVQR